MQDEQFTPHFGLDPILPTVLFILFIPFGYQLQLFIWWEQLVRYALLCAVFISVDLMRNNMRPTVIGLIGRITFPVYLWHIIAKLGALYITSGYYNVLYYLITTLSSILLVLVLAKNKNKKIQLIIGR